MFLAGLLALSACGFTPLYGPGGAGALIGAVDIDAPTNRNEFDLVARLTERLGPVSNPAWRLTFSIATGSEGFSASGATRRQLTGTANWTLTPKAGGKPLSGKVRALAGYTEMLSSPTDTSARLSNAAARDDANRRLMVMLADRIIEDMAIQVAGAAP